MYRRRTPKAQPVNPVEPSKQEHPKPKEEKNEPVIKAVYVQRGAALDEHVKCPMLSTLRSLNYFDNSTGYYVPYEVMVDILLSKGFLNVNENTYKTTHAGTTITDAAWRGFYDKTSNYTRKTFVPGDLIFAHNANISIAFLITTVFKGNDTSNIRSELDYNPPVGEDVAGGVDNKFLSCLTTCDGCVYMFRKNKMFSEVKDLVSMVEGKYRVLEPSNMSEYKGVNPEFNNDDLAETKKEPEKRKAKEPESGDLPAPNTDETEQAQFNLSSGVTVEGWIIYMTSTATCVSEDKGVTTANDASACLPAITGEVIKSGPVVITTIGSTALSLGGVLTFPFDEGNLGHVGNVTRFAAEPLNSQQYQLNYGETNALENITGIKDSGIYSLKHFIKNA